MKNLYYLFLLSFFFLATLSTAFSQGVTTSGMSGLITDDTGEGLPGANVVAVHQPSGTKYFATTTPGGLFSVQGMRVGGPYKVTVTYVGFQNYVVDGINLKLGENYSLFVFMSSEAQQLQEVEITDTSDPTLSTDKTGVATNVSKEQIVSLPTISRSAQDYYRLTPAAAGNSFGGRNNQYNNFSFDGALLNNPFGLDAAVAGGQAAANPISLDAVEQIQVSLSPFDVRQGGFSGANVNLVTRSGTNEFSGSVFYFFRNENLTGSKVDGDDIVVPELTASQFGFRLGGPIVKDKLFFFVNGEFERREDAGSNFLAARPGLSGSNVSRVTAVDLERVSDFLFDNFGYETGVFENYLHERESDKILFKLDWNAHPNHSVSLKYNFLNSFRDLPANESAIFNRGPSPTTLQFFNSGYRINNDLNSGVLEINSKFAGNKFANRFLGIVQSFRDRRDPFSSPFPPIQIFEDGIEYIIAGHEPFSINNELDQDVMQISNNFDAFLGKHIATAGFVFEKFWFRNSFNLFGYGSPFVTYGSVDDFINNFPTPADDPANINPDGPFNNDFITVGQLGFYLQDEWYASEKLKLTLGLRLDWPLFFDTEPRVPNDNTDANGDIIPYVDENGNRVFLDNTQFPEQDPLFSPRFGFNYDLSGDKSMVIRGGTGLFTGRLPFVWIANQVSNPFNGFLNITSPDFNFPQVWKSNIGFDKVLPSNIIGTLDVNYANDVNAVLVRNYSLAPPSGTLNSAGFNDDRSIYLDSDIVLYEDPNFGPSQANAYVFDNTDEGYQLNISAQFRKNFNNGLNATLGYNFTQAEDLNSIPAEISSDAFNLNPIINNANLPPLTPSLYGNRHRILGSASKKFNYAGNKFATTVSFFFEYVEGGRFSYTYFGDLNNDGSFTNDILYIPTEAELNAMTFTGSDAEQQAQRDAFNQYIEQDEYLRSRRGDFAEANGGLRPWFSTWDVRILQDYNFEVAGKPNTIQFSIDIINFGNLLNSEWGVRQINTSGAEAERPIGVQLDATNSPIYTFDTNLQNTFANDLGLNSRWQIQFGLRYIFN